MKGEAAFLEVIGRHFPGCSLGVGIGDDAAVIDIPSPAVVTTDVLIENVDFTRELPVRFIARKSLAANVSDLAAMGAVPHAFVCALGIPEWFEPGFETFTSELAAAAREARIELVGGDLSAADALTISITAIGRIAEGARPLLRSGARRGDRLFLSRPVGASAAGLALMTKGWRIFGDGSAAPPPHAGGLAFAHRELAASLLLRHAAPEAETALGAALARIPEVGACIDVSDGLALDLSRLLAASGCGAVVDWRRIPPFPDLVEGALALGIDVRASVLEGGEEYALLFTASATESELSSRLRRPVYAIGRITEGSGIILDRDGERTPLEPRGFDHFAR
jgi:thiamine-monophosphate kinase